MQQEGFMILWYKLILYVMKQFWLRSEPRVPQTNLAPLQNVTCTLQHWNNVIFRPKHNCYNSYSKYEQPGRKEERQPALWFWYRSGFERLSHPIPLREDGLTGSGPLPRPHETKLIWSAWTKEDVHPQHRIS